MKTALITTTINVPHVLQLYRAHRKDVAFFVAIDEKTPEAAINFCQYDVADCKVLFVQDQEKWKCSKPIGWNCVERRNLALLEALKWGADSIVSVDDDNIPLDCGYFDDFQCVFQDPFDGLMAGSPGNWFDPGQWQFPRDGIDAVVQRGIPQSIIPDSTLRPITNVKVGLAQGLVLGDPDTSAVDRISRHPQVHQVSELLRAGVVVDNRAWTVANAQNTAFIRELAPAMFQPPGCGRYSDIWASMICQRIMRDRGYYLHYGRPFVWQERNQHNLLDDLRDELLGMHHTLTLAAELDAWQSTPDQSVLNAARFFYSASKVLTPPAKEAAAAFFEDCEGIL